MERGPEGEMGSMLPEGAWLLVVTLWEEARTEWHDPKCTCGLGSGRHWENPLVECERAMQWHLDSKGLKNEWAWAVDWFMLLGRLVCGSIIFIFF